MPSCPVQTSLQFRLFKLRTKLCSCSLDFIYFAMANSFNIGILVLVIGGTTWVIEAQVLTLPQLDPDEWWGPAELQGDTNTTIRPFRIQFTQKMIKDLKSRLRNRRDLTPPLEGIGFEYGFNTQQVDPWVKYWTEEYDFKEREKFFNQFPHYKTNIQGLDIHFIRVKPKVPASVKTVPLLILHGWPGSVREFYEVIPLLTSPADGYDFIFEVIVPSLPGFGFSDGAARPGLGPIQMAVIFKNLMARLGYDKFYVQGGDWGSVICKAMATIFQKEVLGFHTNLMSAVNSCSEIKVLVGAITASQQLTLNQTQRNVFTDYIEETGYFHLQATKPDTLGVSLSDSPVGLLTYILEKFSAGIRLDNRFRPDGGLYDRFSEEQLIDNLMVYWSTSCITTSMRIYAEAFSTAHRALRIDDLPTPVPIWNLVAKNELLNQPPNLMKFPNLLGGTVLDGGHFLAFELPQPFSADVFKAVKAFRAFHEARTEL
ncbi:juvenile hormone epoxide hydrolase-like isoform X1 [Maniola jurtina]|uniref:juvenile hormone epoxide hydrolase-like isoform X1 n=1 Tax=Maniola jurtina TaxID=191418 RepID=UPI001E68AEBA|nr:juvenile hormone epoxide hydrolase-like isoform X1 [Maniola jurtina]